MSLARHESYNQSAMDIPGLYVGQRVVAQQVLCAFTKEGSAIVAGEEVLRMPPMEGHIADIQTAVDPRSGQEVPTGIMTLARTGGKPPYIISVLPSIIDSTKEGTSQQLHIDRLAHFEVNPL